MPLDPACAAAVGALEDDPFYRAICGTYVSDPVRGRAVLAQYFDYSIQEGREIGRAVHLPDPALGVAVWLLPQPAAVQSRAAQQKCAFLESILDAQGCANYYRIVDFMHSKSAAIIHPTAWYLSIIAVDPRSQGLGHGRMLLERTLAEADSALAACYLETFNPRNFNFYQRLGFTTQARLSEPTTYADYAIMVRLPAAADRISV